MNVEQVVQHYVELRDRKKAIEQQAKEQIAPIEQDMEQIEAALQKHMLEQNVKSLPTKAGTPYLQEVSSARVYDWEKVLDYVVENQEYDAFERRVNKSWLKEVPHEVPGVELASYLKTNIRSS